MTSKHTTYKIVAVPASCDVCSEGPDTTYKNSYKEARQFAETLLQKSCWVHGLESLTISKVTEILKKVIV